MFGSLGGPELFLILVIALIVFGPRKLPEIGKSLGKMMMEFKKASNEFRQTIESEVEADKQREAVRTAAVAEVPTTSSSAPTAAVGTHHEEAEIPSATATVSREAPPPPVAPK